VFTVDNHLTVAAAAGAAFRSLIPSITYPAPMQTDCHAGRQAGRKAGDKIWDVAVGNELHFSLRRGARGARTSVTNVIILQAGVTKVTNPAFSGRVVIES
jgi:hypothetical protein